LNKNITTHQHLNDMAAFLGAGYNVNKIMELEQSNAALTAQVERMKEGIKDIGEIRKSNLYQTCIDCDGDRCDHGASHDLIMKKVAALLEEGE
jgi:hypothetical protein